MCEFIRNVIECAKNAPLHGHMFSTNHYVKEIKRIHGLNDEMFCVLLHYMYNEGMIRDFGFRYCEWNPEKIDYYWFR